MRKLLLAALLLLPIGAHAQAQPSQIINCIKSPAQPCNTNAQVGNATDGDHAWLAFGKANANAKYIAYGGPIFPAENFGSCLWGPSGDVGPCINQAIAAAATAGGGTVFLPASPAGSYFGFATPIANGNSGVSLGGVGFAHTFASGQYAGGTELVWNGSAQNGPAVYVGTNTGTAVYSASITGISFHCANLVLYCLEIQQVSHSIFDFASTGASTGGVSTFLTTNASGTGNGTQFNDFSISTGATTNATALLIDHPAGSGTDVSVNYFRSILVTHSLGDAIVMGAQDGNDFWQTSVFPNTISSGQPPVGRNVVMANSAYVPPNGIPVVSVNSGPTSGQTRFWHTDSQVTVMGFQTGSVFATVTSNGSAVVPSPPATLTMTATAVKNSSTLTFTSSPVSAGWEATETITCTGNGDTNPGIDSGVPPGDQIFGAPTSSTVGLLQPTVQPINLNSASTTCQANYGIQQSAAPGVYTISFATSTHWSITAPSGGNSQSGITADGNSVLNFTDLTLPISGTPADGDSWTLTVPSPATNVRVAGVDHGNGVPLAFFEWGATGSTGYINDIVEQQFGNVGNIFCNRSSRICPANPTGEGALATAGNTTGVTGPYAAAIGGVANQASNFGSFASGNGNISSGAYSSVWGENGNDGGRKFVQCLGSNDFAVTGDAQGCMSILRGSGSSASAFRLTAEGSAAGSQNCVNIPNNSSYSLGLEINAFDHTTVTKSINWYGWHRFMTRGANAASTALDSANATPPTPLTNGTVTGASIAATADTTNGCLNISFTPPSGNTDTWNVVAKVQSVETQ